MSGFERWPDLACDRMGGAALATSDEFFAPKENLVKRSPPVFEEGRYTDRGKWMDGWETRRRRGPGHDWVVVRLAGPARIRAVVVDTRHFDGNHPGRASLDACRVLPEEAPVPTRGGWIGADPGWTRVVEEAPVEPDAENVFLVADAGRWTHVRLNIAPDGGVARLRVHGEPRPDWASLAADGAPVDLAAAVHGGRVVGSSDARFGPAANLLLPGRGLDMGDGWETRRRRGPGHDWVVVRLGCRGIVRAIEVDTLHYRGNHPDRCGLDVADEPEEDDDSDLDGLAWRAALPPARVGPDAVHRFGAPRLASATATHVRLTIHPDGGVGRLRVWGEPRIGEER